MSDPTVDRWRACGHRGQHGSATVWVLAAGLLVMAAATPAALAGAATAARHRAQAAADFAALAAAVTALEGPDAACRRADAIATANGAELVACRLLGFDAIVTVAVPPHGGLAGVAQASARAGPA
jgi:secretion/DNA translocation related TadE-like protein